MASKIDQSRSLRFLKENVSQKPSTTVSNLKNRVHPYIQNNYVDTQHSVVEFKILIMECIVYYDGLYIEQILSIDLQT